MTTYVVGKNNHGQLGLNKKNTTNIKQLKKYNVANQNISPTQIHCGYQYTIFIDKNNNYWAVGYNRVGSCGVGNFEESIKTCTEIKHFKQNKIKIQKIFTTPSSLSTFWLSNTNKLYANGRNKQYQFGTQSNKNHSKPILIPGLTDVIDVKSGQYHTLFLSSTGNVYSTKYNKYSNYWGQNGHAANNVDTINCGLKAINSLKNKNIIQIQCGYRHSLFLDCNGIIWCCGDNEYGQLGFGHNQTVKTMRPKPIKYFQSNNILIEAIACGRQHNLALDKKGRVWSWGWNEYQQCGNGSRADINSPRLVTQLKQFKIIKIKCGTQHSYAKSECGYYGKHFLFGLNDFNERSVPFCINDAFKAKRYVYDTDVKWIRDVYLGDQNTFILTFNKIETDEHVTFGFIRMIQQILPHKLYAIHTIPQSIYVLCLTFVGSICIW